MSDSRLTAADLTAAGASRETAHQWTCAIAHTDSESEMNHAAGIGNRIIDSLEEPDLTPARRSVLSSLNNDLVALRARWASQYLPVAALAHFLADYVGNGRAGWLDHLEGAAPEMLPTAKQLHHDRARPRGVKVGYELSRAVLTETLLAHPSVGLALMEAMRRPAPEAQALARQLGTQPVELDHATVHRDGTAAVITISNPHVMNAEDEGTLPDWELATDVALLDASSTCIVFRGAAVTSAKYAGRPLLGAGINLTALANGEISYDWFIRRELGLVNKIAWGLVADSGPITKPWMGVAQECAIGGHLQLLLAMDRIIATPNARVTLPAAAEGLVPGAAPYRLARMIGARTAHDIIFGGRAIDLSDPAMRFLPTHVTDDIDSAVGSAVEAMNQFSPISAAANRTAYRNGIETPEGMRAYLTSYAATQAQCLFSDDIAPTLSRTWTQRPRLKVQS